MAEWTFRVLQCTIGALQAKFPAPAVKPSVNASSQCLEGGGILCVVCLSARPGLADKATRLSSSLALKLHIP